MTCEEAAAAAAVAAVVVGGGVVAVDAETMTGLNVGAPS